MNEKISPALFAPALKALRNAQAIRATEMLHLVGHKRPLEVRAASRRKTTSNSH